MKPMSISGILLCLTVAQSLIYYASAQGVDLTRVPKANGAAVVHAATGIIQSSGIFENDHGLLRRIAYIESKDGTDDDTFSPESFGGIWQLNRNAFRNTKNESAYGDILRPKLQAIHECLGIDWLQVNSSDLHKALHSALAARLFLSIIDEPIPIDIEDQARYWKQHYCDTFRADCTIERFIQAVLANEGQERCETRGLDLIFLLDSSASISRNSYELVRQFVLDVSRIFRIGPKNTQIGVTVFSDSSQVIFDLNKHQNRQSLERAIRRIPHLRGATDTAAGLRDALRGFSTARGARPLSEAVPRVAIVLTDGLSDVPGSTKLTAQALLAAGIQIYAIGVGERFNMRELQNIASDPDERFIHSVSAFGAREFRTLRRALRETACGLGTDVVIGDAPVVTTISQGERINIHLSCPEDGATLELCVQDGSSVLYASDDIEIPNEALYDYRLIAGNGSCASVFISCKDFCSSQNPNSNRTDIGNSDNMLHITIQGSGENNTISIQVLPGDIYNTTTPNESPSEEVPPNPTTEISPEPSTESLPVSSLYQPLNHPRSHPRTSLQSPQLEVPCG